LIETLNQRCVDFRASMSAGFTLTEMLVSLLVISFGLLGLAGLQTRIQQAELESYQRAQALVLMYDMVERIQLHRAAAPCFVITSDVIAGTPYLGSGAARAPACGSGTAAQKTLVDRAIAEWDVLLKGLVESKSDRNGARGCISYDRSSELKDAAGAVRQGTGMFTVTVAWQGSAPGFAPAANCANASYGNEAGRRAVSTRFRMANLK
jgi:type IV pilus assembly protein PilV